LVGGSGIRLGGIGDGIGTIGKAGDEFLGQALLAEGDVGEIIEVAAVCFDLRAPIVVVVEAAGPNGGDTGAALVGGGAGAAAAAPPAAG